MKLTKIYSALLMIASTLFSLNVYSEVNAHLSLKPMKCVSLKQGQTCYAEVTLHWRTGASGDYCLHSSHQKAPLQCWRNTSAASFNGEIAAKQNVIFTLQMGDRTLADAEMQMAWVYKKKRSAVSWRVF